MNNYILAKHIRHYLQFQESHSNLIRDEQNDRMKAIAYYQSFSEDKIAASTTDDIFNYLSKLWAMVIWGNKHYVIDKIIEMNGLDRFKSLLAELLWSNLDIENRWDNFKHEIKGMGPAMISEILCKTHPNDFMLWNRRAYVGFSYLEVPNLPIYDYQMKGRVYSNLCSISKQISSELVKAGFDDNTLLALDYFVWRELQPEKNLTKAYGKRLQKKD